MYIANRRDSGKSNGCRKHATAYLPYNQRYQQLLATR